MGNTDLPASPENPAVAAFFRDGFFGPIDLLTRAQCELILKHYRRGVPPRKPEWPKDLAVHDRLFYEVTRQPALIALLRPILGEDIKLWGASVVERAPGQTHIWHTDIETSAPDGRFVTVWIGLENTSQDSALQLISRSHRFGRPIQQEVYERGMRRGEATDAMVMAWAQERDCLSDFVQPDMSDGQALFSDGRLWHASNNAGDRTRAALLLQYTATDTPVVIPDFNHLEWPFRFTSAESPSVVVTANSKTRNVAPLPSACASRARPVRSQVHPGSGFEESCDGWAHYHLFQGPTPLLTEMESHVSVLSPGCSPHPPHCHVQEELLIVLCGEAEILIANGPNPNGARIERLRPGCFVYYPAYQYHTIRNTSASPVTYLMYKWQSAPAEVSHPMQTKVFATNGAPQRSPMQPMAMPVLFEASTAYLDKLHAHVTDLQVGAGYPAHIDDYDVAIVVLSGTVETLCKKLGPGGTVFYAAGEPHGMRNVGDEPARYLVFEFHRSRPVETCIRTQRSTRPGSSKLARRPVTEHAILVFGHTRPEALQFVLEGLRRQDALADTQVWLDGHQEFADLLPFVRACQALEASYPEAQWYKYGSRCGFTKLFIDAVLLNCSRHKQLIMLQDDCYPAPSAIDALLSSLREIENDPHIFSVYGHHFGTPDEGRETSAFQGWGWASSSDKLQPVVTELSRLWNMPEPHALAWFQQHMTPEIRARMDLFPGRAESKLLDGRFCHDAAMAFLIARNGMSNRKTREHVIYNFGIGERCWHFPTLVDRYLKPPFNMIPKNELIGRFSLQDLPPDDELLARHGVPDLQGRLNRLDAEVQMLRDALATSERDRADRLDVIKRLDAEVQTLRAGLATSEQDRADRLEALKRLDADVRNLHTAVATSEQDRADRLAVIKDLDAEAQRLRTALAASEQDRADRLAVINHLEAHADRLQTQIKAQERPWRRAVSRAASVIRGN
jgi:uncharacterized cupin superfamily protein/quercetin dioxygenase-like cupin family protein